MAYTYTRQSTFSDGDTVTAALFNNEYNQLLNAFAYSSSDAGATGHRHDGTAAQGGSIYRIGDLDFLNKIEADSTNNRWGFYVQVSSSAVEQIRVQDGAIVPVTDNDIDLGTGSLEFKDAFFDGTVTTDALVADTADINGGTVDGAIVGGSSAAAGSFTTIAASGAFTGSSTVQGTTITATTAFVPDASDGAALGTTSLEFSDLYLADGALIYFGDDQDINITHVADTGLTTSGTFQATTITATTAFVPDASDGAALGTSSLEFSDLYLADGAVVYFGDDQDVSLTHVADTGILLSSTDQLQFGDSGTYIHQSADGVLDLVSDTEIEINATTIDINGAVEISGNALVSGEVQTANIGYTDGDNAIVIADGGGVTLSTSLTLASGAAVTSILDQDTLSSDSATALATQQSIKAYVDANVTSGAMTSWVLEDGDGTEVSVTNSKEVKFVEGGGIDINWTDTDNGTDGDPYDLTFTINAAQTDITSLLATDIKIGEDDQTKIDFETADTINFYAGNEKQLVLTDGALTPGTNAIVDLGTDALEFKDAYFDGTVEADAITIAGVTLAETIADTVGAMVSSNTETGISVTYEDGDNTLDFALGAAQTTITSLLATDIKIGEDDETKVDFGTVNEIHLYADNTKRVTVDATGLTVNSGSLETATIDYTDGDLAITIADGGGITAAAGITSTAAANALGTTSVTGALQLKNAATSAGYLEFFEDTDNGTNKVTLIGPASTADITLTLPSSDGDSGQFLQTNGSGVMSWEDSTGMSTSKAFYMGQL